MSKILRTEYSIENGKPIIHVFGRDSNGKRTLVKDSSLRPYLYCSLDECTRVPDVEIDISKPYISVDGTELAKIYTDLPEGVPLIREKYSRSYEADVLFPLRYLIDKVDTLEEILVCVLGCMVLLEKLDSYFQI